MSLDLTILPVLNGDIQTATVIECPKAVRFDPDCTLFSEIENTLKLHGRGYAMKPVLEPKPLPLQLKIEYFVDHEIVRTRTDNYGEELTYVPAGDFEKVNTPKTKKNDTILEYLKQLPPETPVILMWS